MDNISRYVSSFDQSFLILLKSDQNPAGKGQCRLLQSPSIYEIICSFANFLRRNYHAGVTIKVDHCNVLSARTLAWFHTDHGHVLYISFYIILMSPYSNVHVYVHVSTPIQCRASEYYAISTTLLWSKWQRSCLSGLF